MNKILVAFKAAVLVLSIAAAFTAFAGGQPQLIDPEAMEIRCGQTYAGCVSEIACNACQCKSGDCYKCSKTTRFKRCGGTGTVVCSDLADPCNCGDRFYYTGETCSTDADCFCDGEFTTQADCVENGCSSANC